MFIITSDPRSCVWIIAFLKNFRLAEKADKTKTTRNSMGMEEGIARISDRINKQLQIMKVVLEERI